MGKVTVLQAFKWDVTDMEKIKNYTLTLTSSTSSNISPVISLLFNSLDLVSIEFESLHDLLMDETFLLRSVKFIVFVKT